ncbi:hypothetical protein Pla175_30020 [Pirellulimonas nuda]|uniref:Uncharacterized protein n=1 Tax=Pirellulimonas nuda TaxID=2528009 RepID=A0A518DDQ9_9BACT|nr:hypothetical protein [Pirellulimonas nuda]QDU89609.1 hypothetical protein Pla175_30020 [Pirellulimonas nuda]
MNRTPRMLLLSLMLLLASVGCEDDRVTQVAREAADRQAAQNEAMASVTRESAEATRQIVAVHSDLQAERRELSGGWNDLESERRQIAQQRRTESALALAVRGAGVVLIVLLTLGVVAILLLGQRQDDGNQELVALVVRESLRSGSPFPELLRGDSTQRLSPRLHHHPEENA